LEVALAIRRERLDGRIARFHHANCASPTGATLGSSSFLIGPGRVGVTTIVPSIPLESGAGVSATAIMQASAISAAAIKENDA
jgi:hypothetical protein